MTERITIETEQSALDNAVMPECLGACSILNAAPEGDREAILQHCAERTQIWCSGPRPGQLPERTICGQASDIAKSIMMSEVRATRL